MALAGRRFGCGRGVSGQRLWLSWHHTRSFWQRSRAESEQSRGSFARQTIIFAFARKGRLEAPDAPPSSLESRAHQRDATALARISHTNRRIGSPNQRKLLCCNDFTQIEERPDADRV